MMRTRFDTMAHLRMWWVRFDKAYPGNSGGVMEGWCVLVLFRALRLGEREG